MNPDAILFWILALITGVSALAVLLFPNPIFSALSLAMTMIGVAALFVTLSAYFLAGVQLIVYAGAVMVLFVMVLMLFDLHNEVFAFSSGTLSGLLKLLSMGALSGFFVGALLWSGLEFLIVPESQQSITKAGTDATQSLGELLFTKYVFGFEALGILLLIVAVGAVALARSKGGTHARS